jgi:hypothetical protein
LDTAINLYAVMNGIIVSWIRIKTLS